MKLLFDHNLSPGLPVRLNDLYPESTQTHLIHYGRSPDRFIWEYARDNGFILVSKDSDFVEMATIHGFPPKFIWIKVGNCSTRKVEILLRTHCEGIRKFVVSTELDIYIID